jgi:hypothetical protein
VAENTPEVKVKLTAEDTGVAAAIKELGQQLKNLKQQEDETSKSAITLKSAFDALASSAALIKLEQIGAEAFDSAINIGKMADKTGLSTETLSVFHKVAGDVGVQMEAVDRGLVKAAKSITQFQQGSKAAAAGFQLLGLKQKDFIGLNSDQKIQLVTTALGKMHDGFQKTTAAQEIFSKGGAEMIVVANRLADEGFDKATAATKRLGLLLGGELVESARVAKESMQEVKDTASGMATQFEAGLLPAIADVSVALGQSMNAGDDGLQMLGKDAGAVIKFIAEGFISVGKIIGAVFASVENIAEDTWSHVKNEASTLFHSLAAAASGDLKQAFLILEDGARKRTQIAQDEVEKQRAIYKGLFKDLGETDIALFASGEEEKAFGAQEKATQDAITNLRSQEIAVREKLNQGVISQQEAEKEIKNLLAQQIPLIQEKAQAELKFAEAQGHSSQIARARATVKQVAALTPEGEPPPLPGGADKIDPAVVADIKRQEREEEIAKGNATALHAQLQGELDIWKAFEKQRDEAEKDSYERGELSTTQYYARRQADLKTETEKELSVLRQQLDEAKGQELAASVNYSANVGAAQKSGGADTKEGQAYLGQAQRDDQERLAALAKIQDVEAKISVTQIDGDTKAMALDREALKARQESQQKVLEFQKEIAALQGKTLDVSKSEIEIEVQRRTIELQQAGQSKSQIDAEIAQYRALKQAAADFANVEKRESEDQKIFETEKAGIEIQEKAGLITKSQAEKKINDLIRERLPLLMREAQEELAIAQASGNQQEIAKAQELIIQLQNLSTATAGWKAKLQQASVEAKSAFSQDFMSFFQTLQTGTKSVGQAFTQLGVSVVQSLEKIAEQMLINFALTKLMDALGLGNDGGAAQLAKTIATNDSIILSDAGAAGAAAFASAIETVPFPANIPVAEAAMGVAVSSVLSNLSLGSAAEGALLNRDMLLHAHAEEMVLPPKLSVGLQGAIETGRFESPAALSEPVSGARSGSTIHNHNEVNLYHNGPDAREILERELVPRLQRAMRTGAISR